MSLAKQIGSVSKTALTNAGHMNMNNEIYARVKTDTTKARKATDETLDLIIQRVNAYAVLEPTEAINAFIDTVNQIFRKYKNLIAAKENYEIAMERYLLGDLPGIEMREAQKSLLAAEERILTAQYNTKLCEISLQQISGNVMVYLE